MGSVDDAIAEVLRLDEAATKGPWIVVRHDWRDGCPLQERWIEAVGAHEPKAGLSGGNFPPGTPECAQGEANVLTMVRYRTLAPELARECQRLRGMLRTAVKMEAKRTIFDAQRDSDIAEEEWVWSANLLGLPPDSPDRADLWPMYRTAFEAELAQLKGGSGG